ncbi:MAG: DUF1810 domain-containing protein [Verrucomicrobiales bacterium]|nr:DUF1810 domain-containing protein [Verrucomicrobiales bacterium]
MAQEAIYDLALQELHEGKKQGHWMWYVFPQIAGLGNSPQAREYAIRDLDEARQFILHPLLSDRLVQCAKALLVHGDVSASDILGDTDAMKLKSSMTLFHLAARGEEAVFKKVLDQFYGGQHCRYTAGKISTGQRLRQDVSSIVDASVPCRIPQSGQGPP